MTFDGQYHGLIQDDLRLRFTRSITEVSREEAAQFIITKPIFDIIGSV